MYFSWCLSGFVSPLTVLVSPAPQKGGSRHVDAKWLPVRVGGLANPEGGLRHVDAQAASRKGRQGGEPEGW
jgi:hypothetical protein